MALRLLKCNVILFHRVSQNHTVYKLVQAFHWNYVMFTLMPSNGDILGLASLYAHYIQTYLVSLGTLGSPPEFKTKFCDLERCLTAKHEFVMTDPHRTNSPSSWGNSSHTMAVDVLNPVSTDTVNEAPIARPSMKLCSASLRVIIHATVLMLEICCPRSQLHITPGTWTSCKSERTRQTHDTV